MTTYITLDEAKDQLAIDSSLTLHDAQIQMMIGAATDWAENFTNRSLGELLELNSPVDTVAVPIKDPDETDPTWPGSGWIWGRAGGCWINSAGWGYNDFLGFWAQNPPLSGMDHAQPLRRDVKAAILLYIQTLFDRNIADLPLLEKRAVDLLWPYRRGMGI